MTRQIVEPLITHRNGRLCFTDWDYGFRTPTDRRDPSHVRGAETAAANLKALQDTTLARLREGLRG